MSLNTGQVLNNRYRIARLLGQGGFGAVYRAWDILLERPCALKESFDTSPEAQRQFLREARILANLTHPNLPRVSDYFTIPDQGQYLVMDFVEGEDLQAHIKERSESRSEAQALTWIMQICDALAYLHTQIPPVIHRDIKPANIKITPAGQAMLVDFGIAKVYDPHLKTTIGARAVTPGYSPPEQYGQGTTDARSDVYSLGATLYAMLTRQEPVESVQRTVGVPLPSPRILNPEISPPIEAAILRAMQLLPDDRFASAAELKTALQAPSTGPALVQAPGLGAAPTYKVEAAAVTAAAVQKPPPSTPAKTPVSPRPASPRMIWLVALGGLLMLVCALAFGVLYAGGVIGGKEATPTSLAQAASPTNTSLPPTPVRQKPTSRPTMPPTKPPTLPPVAPPVQDAFLACLVTDTGGINDRSFNATAWQGVEAAMGKLGIQGKFLESKQPADYEANIKIFIDEGCDLIVTVGFTFGEATKKYAQIFPAQKFSIVDFAYEPPLPNVFSQVFKVQDAAFMAGYLAAGVTQTGKVATFGGIQIPPVTAFMDGFANGVQHYNAVHGTKVQVLGWNPASQTGLFTGNFESVHDGHATGISLMDKGADIIFPVAGPVGLGTAAAAMERKGIYVIGVDSDWYISAPDYRPVILTSVMKRMDVTTFEVVLAAFENRFSGGAFNGSLANGGVDIAPYHDLAWLVPPALQAELDQLRNEIASGKVNTTP